MIRLRPKAKPESSGKANAKKKILPRVVLILTGIGLAGAVVGALLLAFALILARPNLPSIDALVDYRPKVPLRIYTADHVLIGEFGEERRNLTRIKDIPDIMKKAVLAIEDDRFYEHGGVDYVGVIRAGVVNLRGGLSQGASTITMQVARNFFLSSEKTFVRKIYEMLLAYKIEANLTKDQILELYMNQIYLGQRAYGFASAAQIYFGKQLKDVSIAEAAMLAGLPKAPSAYNPVVNPQRAKQRQQYILQRMRDLRYITQVQYEAAPNEPLKVRGLGNEFTTKSDYAAEMVRQMLYAEYKDEIYTRGFTVYTTLIKADQDAAYASVRKGIVDYERRHGYRGPEAFVELPGEESARQSLIDETLVAHPDNDDLRSAVVLSAAPAEVKAVTTSGNTVSIAGEGLKFAAAGLAANAQPKIKIRPGAVIRLIKNAKGDWEISQMPEVEAAFVAASPEDGSIRALVGGFDFNRNKFNHVTQAWRQPGSSFKPFIYSASLEKGFSPSTIINDAPLSFGAAETGSTAWEPKNYDGKFEGPMSMRRALAKSKNLVSIRILRAIGPQYAQEYITRFGFDAERHPAYLTMALGAGSVTPLQMVTAYSVFANGGYKVRPYLIQRVEDARGKVLAEAQPQRAGDESLRVIDARNAFVMDSLLKEVARAGTAVSAYAALKRNDLAGKTGTTNDSIDAWFAGYTPKLVAITWMGYDNPRSLGDRETGGGVSLPLWINYMRTALKSVPEVGRETPPRLVQSGGDWMYEENAGTGGVRSLGLNEGAQAAPAADPEKEKQTILDMFKR
ncbi:MAG: penicillin-binding protein 1A [Candidatus Protistobacter heckmanni]|nr:penicillin-binding protein 1A [Candidatus Protistobacter heckmanni]